MFTVRIGKDVDVLASARRRGFICNSKRRGNGKGIHNSQRWKAREGGREGEDWRLPVGRGRLWWSVLGDSRFSTTVQRKE